jgi:hypothetical protein
MTDPTAAGAGLLFLLITALDRGLRHVAPAEPATADSG